eukprot:2358462-Rhodomonas_salina.2
MSSKRSASICQWSPSPAHVLQQAPRFPVEPASGAVSDRRGAVRGRAAPHLRAQRYALLPEPHREVSHPRAPAEGTWHAKAA